MPHTSVTDLDISSSDFGRQIFYDDKNKIYIEDFKFSRTHDSGNWTISGIIHENYWLWVEDFEATHPKYGNIIGNFEKELIVDSIPAITHFLEHHPYKTWDYYDC